MSNLNVSLKGLDVDTISTLFLDLSEDDLKFKPYLEIILEDLAVLQDPVRGLEHVSLRDLAVHSYNRAMYFNMRRHFNRDPVVHEVLDELLDLSSPQVGSMNPYLSYIPDGAHFTKWEPLGRYNFKTYIDMHPEYAKDLESLGWKFIQ